MYSCVIQAISTGGMELVSFRSILEFFVSLFLRNSADIDTLLQLSDKF